MEAKTASAEINASQETVKEESVKPASKLVIINGPLQISQVRLEGTATIGGSEKKEADILVDSRLFSGIHGQFIMKEDGFWYQHMDTQNYTYYNDVLFGTSALSRKNPVKLKDGDAFHVGGRTESEKKESGVAVIFLKRYNDKSEWKTVDLARYQPTLHITRHEDAEDAGEISTDAVKLPSHYATLTFKNNEWAVEDHNTRTGVYVNNRRVEKSQALEDFDLIRIGSTTFLYESGTLYYNHKEYSDNRLVIRIEERSVWNLFKKHVLLKDINLDISPGEMVLVLGGSGAGKTTFINAVMGYEKARGKITQGEHDIYEEYDEMKYKIGFVPQEDLLRMEDSVEYTLVNAAELKLPVSVSDEERECRIDEVLEIFGLEREKKSLVEKLSGGQRKRLSIAVEYISDPQMFFLDEPDSGLDAVMARSLMENLRKIADEERIVLVITHSPNRVEDLFDKVIVLARDAKDNIGRLTYYGTPDEAREFFGCEDMESIIKRINRTDEGGEGRADEFIEKYAAMED